MIIVTAHVMIWVVIGLVHVFLVLMIIVAVARLMRIVPIAMTVMEMGRMMTQGKLPARLTMQKQQLINFLITC